MSYKTLDAARVRRRWIGDARCGDGTLTAAGGETYEGQWWLNQRNGQGRCISSASTTDPPSSW